MRGNVALRGGSKGEGDGEKQAPGGPPGPPRPAPPRPPRRHRLPCGATPPTRPCRRLGGAAAHVVGARPCRRERLRAADVLGLAGFSVAAERDCCHLSNLVSYFVLSRK